MWPLGMGCLTTKEVTFHSLRTAGLFASMSDLPCKFLEEACWSGGLEPQDVWGGMLEEICLIHWRWGREEMEVAAGDLLQLLCFCFWASHQNTFLSNFPESSDTSILCFAFQLKCWYSEHIMVTSSVHFAYWFITFLLFPCDINNIFKKIGINYVFNILYLMIVPELFLGSETYFHS